MDNRRKHERVTQPLEGKWRGLSGAAPCRISDISWGGCFIQTVTQPTPGDKTLVTVIMPVAGAEVEIVGRVLYTEPSMGFAVTFESLSSAQKAALAEVLGEPEP